jgi:ParB-like chromosome segregation protein Spo0J
VRRTVSCANQTTGFVNLTNGKNQMSKLAVKYIKRDKLIPYDNNPRTHSEAQINQLAESIKEFGFTNPILIDEHNGIIAGHGRLDAAALLGLNDVPTITLKGLSEIQRRAYIIADNKLALNAEWSYELLKLELQELSDSDFILDVLGFSEFELLPYINEVIDDHLKEWDGMPEFDQEDDKAFRSIIIHFNDQEAVDQFQEVTKLPLTEKTKYAWYPEIDIQHVADKRYTDES